MNLYNKLMQYLFLRRKGFSRKAAFQTFKYPLTDADWSIIIVVAIAIFIVIGYLWQQKHLEKVAGIWQEAIHERAQRVKSDKAMVTYEQVLIELLNGGQIMVDGKTHQYCKLNFVGECDVDSKG